MSEWNKTVCGKNLFNINADYIPQSPTGYTVVVNGTEITVTGQYFIKYLINVAPNTDYYIKFTKLSGTGNIVIYNEAITTAIKSTAGTFNSGGL